LPGLRESIKPKYLLKVAFDTHWEKADILPSLHSLVNETSINDFFIFVQGFVAVVAQVEV
jgi:hypothetical protein